MHTGDAIPTLQELLSYIDPQYTAHWKELARELGVEECDIRDISDNNAHAKKCLTAMFEQWQKVVRPATWDKLNDALKNIELSSTTSNEKEGSHSHYCSALNSLVPILLLLRTKLI